MTWLWIILRWLFPSDEVRQGVEGLKQMVGHMAGTVFTEDWLRAAENDPEMRLYLEEMIIDYEEGLSTMIGARACQIAKLPFHPPHKSWYRPSRAKPLVCLMLRLSDLVEACLDLERRAQVRAGRLQRERDADPLSLRASGPLRHAALLRATSPSFAGGGFRVLSSLVEGGGDGSRALARETACRAEAQRRGEGAGRNAAGCARGPPPTIVQLHPKPASQAHLRDRARLRQTHPSLTCHATPEGLSCV